MVKLIATGGTIAMKIDPVKNAPVPAISGEDLVATVPEIAKVARIEVQNLSNVPSDYMHPERWVGLQKAVLEAFARPEVACVIVSHGTDTLEETAYFLDLTVQNEKPIVLIGAQRNASEKDFDGPRDLLNAARVCTTSEARGKGAMIVLNNQINAAREVTKTHTSDVETFKSGDFGFLGVADNDRVIFSRAPTRRQHVPHELRGEPLAEPAGGENLERRTEVAAAAGGDPLACQNGIGVVSDYFSNPRLAWGAIARGEPGNAKPHDLQSCRYDLYSPHRPALGRQPQRPRTGHRAALVVRASGRRSRSVTILLHPRRQAFKRSAEGLAHQT